MLTLGLVYVNHDSAAALVHDGAIVAAAAEERFNRHKHSAAFPRLALQSCLTQIGADLADISEVGLFTNPWLYYKLAMCNLVSDLPRSFKYLPYPLQIARREFALKRVLRDNVPFRFRKVRFVTHHQAHAGSAFYPSPFDSAAILTIDGRGEYETACIYAGSGNRIRQLYRLMYPHSIGYLYSTVTRFLGFEPFNDEYKVMGLSAYGTTRLVDQFKDVVGADENGEFRLNLRYFDHSYTYGPKRRYFSDRFISAFGPPRFGNDPVTQHHADLAFALQRATEKAFLSLSRRAASLVGSRCLCLAGGVALNCLAVAVVLESGLFDDVFVQPASDDSGTAIGSALVCQFSRNRAIARVRMKDVFLGPEITDDDVRRVADDYRDKFEISRPADLNHIAAKILNDGQILGWCQGRMEFGPRALGNRSILASAVDSGMKDRINASVKFREPFRPFAPVVLAERAETFFTLEGSGRFVYPFMVATAKAVHAQARSIPAVVHEDGTSRIQIVSDGDNSRLHALLRAYEELSGLPVLLNTSFNVRSEPIVCTAEDAVRNALMSDLKYVVIGETLFIKKNQE